MKYVAIIHLIFLIIFIITVKSEKRKNYIKILVFYYKMLKGIDILLLSLFLYSVKDLNSFVSLIPIGNISINLTLYTMIITAGINILENSLLNNKKVSIDASLSPRKLGNTFIKENIQLPSEPGEIVKIYVVLIIKGHVESLLESDISIALPKSATAQLDNNITRQDAFKFPLKDYVSKDGLSSIEITLTKESTPVTSETELEIKLINKSLIKELFVIEMTSEKCGMREKESGKYN